MAPIFFVSASTGYGGAERSVELLLPFLQEKYQVIIFAENDLHQKEAKKLLRPPARLVPLTTGYSWNSVCFAGIKLLFHFLINRPKVIIANTHRSAVALAVAAKIYPPITKRSLLFVRDFMWTDLDLIFKGKSWAMVLIPNKSILDRKGYIAERLEREGIPYQVLPDMVEVPNKIGATPAELPTILHLATINPWKGHGHLIKIAKFLVSSGVPFQIDSYGVIGDLALDQKLKQEIKDQGLEGKVRIHGYSPDSISLIKQCSCLAVTSVSHSGGPESFGRAIIEGWAHGKPVVAFSSGGPKYLIEDGKDGILVEEGDEKSFSDALQRLLMDNDLRLFLGENGRKKAQDNFELKKVSAQFSKIIDAI